MPFSQDIKRALEEAIEGEDYLKAAKLRDELQKKMLDNRIAVEEANERFYRAFMSGRAAVRTSIGHTRAPRARF